MLTGILTRLAAFSLKNPKTILMIVAVLALGAFAVHYKMLVGERDKLKVAEAGYEQAIAAFKQREQTLQLAATNERVAAAAAAASRNEARRALEAFRAGREDDPESVEWAAQPIPAGEQARLCAALPQLEGCE